jgi:hypothetical protein
MGEGGTDNESDRKSVWFGMPIWAWLGGGLVVVALVVVAVWDVSRTSSSSDNDESYVVEREVSWREAQKFCHIPPTAELLDRYYGQYSDGSGDNFHEQYFTWRDPIYGLVDTKIGLYDDGTISTIGTRCLGE